MSLLLFGGVFKFKNCTNYWHSSVNGTCHLISTASLLADAAVLVFGLGVAMQIESPQGLSSILGPAENSGVHWCPAI